MFLMSAGVEQKRVPGMMSVVLAGASRILASAVREAFLLPLRMLSWLCTCCDKDFALVCGEEGFVLNKGEERVLMCMLALWLTCTVVGFYLFQFCGAILGNLCAGCLVGATFGYFDQLMDSRMREIKNSGDTKDNILREAAALGQVWHKSLRSD
ncbi:MAG: hypothetical protein WCH39_13620 [Schlesneria sp.]